MPWLDGLWYDKDVVPFDMRDRGLLLGDGVFDTALVLGGRMVWRQAHVDRLLSATRSLGFTVDPGTVDRAIDAQVSRTDHGTVRITVTRGIGPRGLAPPAKAEPTVIATSGPLPATGFFPPLDLHVTAIRRNDTSLTSRIKSLAYLDGVIAMCEAEAAGCGDALFLNTRGTVACTSAGNIFAMIGRQLVTPPLGDGVLNGITRGILLRTCSTMGLEPIERSLVLDELKAAQAVFVTNSLRLLSSVRSIGGQPTPVVVPTEIEAIRAHLGRLIGDETGTDPRSLASDRPVAEADGDLADRSIKQ